MLRLGEKHRWHLPISKSYQFGYCSVLSQSGHLSWILWDLLIGILEETRRRMKSPLLLLLLPVVEFRSVSGRLSTDGRETDKHSKFTIIFFTFFVPIDRMIS